MGLKRAGTVSAGALAFMAIAVGPSSAQVRDRPDCELGSLLCGVLNSLPGQPAPSPGRPKPRPKPATERRPHDAASHRIRVPSLNGHASPIRPPKDVPALLPDISRQTPAVTSRPAPGEAEPALLSSPAADPADGAIPPFPVAAASCIIGALATVHLNVLARRLRRRV